MADSEAPGDSQALIVGISGPSSSGKTTLARLLQRIFCGVRLGSSDAESQTRSAQDEGVSGHNWTGQSERLNTFIIHEDDFYFPDDQYVPIPHCLVLWCASHWYIMLII